MRLTVLGEGLLEDDRDRHEPARAWAGT